MSISILIGFLTGFAGSEKINFAKSESRSAIKASEKISHE
jgi:hypothetical protein